MTALLVAGAIGLACGLGFWAYALFQRPRERRDGGPYPKVVLPGERP